MSALPHCKTVYVGDTVELRCGDGENVMTPVDWLYQPSPGANGDIIISWNHVTNGFHGGRLEVDASTGALTIHNIQRQGGGVYTCHEGVGAGIRHQGEILIVNGNFAGENLRVSKCISLESL